MAQSAPEFASARHADQYREIDHAPFIAHPIEVGSLLHGDRQPEEVIAAGLLHDLLEKTQTTGAELRRRFGASIARLVESVSDDSSIDDYEWRKHELRNRVAHAGSDTVAIFTADKISKVREPALLPTSSLDDTLTRAKLAHYRASLEMLRRVAGTASSSTFLAPSSTDCRTSSQRVVPGRSGAPVSRAGPGVPLGRLSKVSCSAAWRARHPSPPARDGVRTQDTGVGRR